MPSARCSMTFMARVVLPTPARPSNATVGGWAPGRLGCSSLLSSLRSCAPPCCGDIYGHQAKGCCPTGPIFSSSSSLCIFFWELKQEGGQRDGQKAHERTLNTVDYQSNANQNHNELPPHTSQNGHRQKAINL